MGYQTKTFPYGSKRRKIAQRVGLIYRDDGTWGPLHWLSARGHHATWKERGGRPVD